MIERTCKLEDGGGTFAVFLACDALRRGFRATIYTYNLTVFDPTWFAPGVDIAERLRRQREFKHDPRLKHAIKGYLEFPALGGRLRFVDLTRTLIRGLLRRWLPILTRLSSTYLYRTAREFGPQDTPDDIRGTPSGHFGVLAGYDRRERTVLVAVPYGPHPYGPAQEYWMRIDRVVGAILLGIVTHHANLFIVQPQTSGRSDGLTAWLRRRFSAERFLGIELEVNQRLVFGPAGHWRALRLVLREGLADALSAVAGPDAVESCMRATKP